MWDLLHRPKVNNPNEIFTQSFFNLLCFLMNLNNLVIMPDTTTYQGNSMISYSNVDYAKSALGEDQHVYGNYVNDIFYVIPRRKIDGVGC